MHGAASASCVRLDLVAIEEALRDFAGALPAVNRHASNRVPALDEVSLRQLLHGYAEIDRLEQRGIDLFERGQSRRILGLNHLVLYGDRIPGAAFAARAVEASEQHFYEAHLAGIGCLVDWYEQHRSLQPVALCAGLYLRIQLAPQLFVEGNHRTAALLMSHVLLRHGLPPFVISPRLAVDWFALTPAIQQLPRQGLRSMLNSRRLRRGLAGLIEHQLDEGYLNDQDAADGRVLSADDTLEVNA